MAVTNTTRLGITRWSSGNDPFNRSQNDSDAANLEAKVGLFTAGAIGSRPAAGASNARGFYLATNENAPTGILYYSDGTNWIPVNSFAAPSATLTPGDSASAGSASSVSRSDHSHAMLPWGSNADIAETGLAASAGSAAKYARADHVHPIGNNTVTAGKIATGGVSASGQIADGIITSSHFGSGVVNAAAIAADQRVPVGTILMYGGTVLPTGYLWCDNANYSTTTYAALFAVLGYTWGGSGSLFKTPALSDRIPRGATSIGASATLGTLAGSDTTTGLVNHTHGVGTYSIVAVGDHSHSFSGTTAEASTNHYHAYSGTTNEGGNHQHGPGSGWEFVNVANDGGPTAGVQGVAGSGWTISRSGATGWSGNHAHVIYGNTNWQSDTVYSSHSHTYGGTTANAGGHTHTMSGSSAQAGTGTSVDIRPKTGTVNFIIKI